MGQAKRRREQIAGYAPGQCNGCDLCCVIAKIPEIGKAPFSPCANLCAAGCSLHNSDSKPKTCIDFDCRYIMSHRLDLDDKAIIPHPKEAGAYVSLPHDPRNLIVYVDPKNPRKWHGSRMPNYLRTVMRSGIKVTVIDRGFEFPLSDASHIDAMMQVDLVEEAISRGLKPKYGAEAA